MRFFANRISRMAKIFILYIQKYYYCKTKRTTSQYLMDARIHFPAVCEIRVLTTSESNQFNY